MRFFGSLMLAAFFGVGAVAQAEPFEPARGTELRQELLDLIRPLAVFDLGPSIEFRVMEMMVDENTAFARLMAQRPGGAEIDIAATPMVRWRHVDPHDFDGPRFEVFYIRERDQWQIMNYGMGSTDVWWWGYRCDLFGSLLREWGC